MDQTSHVVYVIDIAADSLFKFDLEGNPVPFSGSAPYLSGNQITGLNFPNEFNRNQVAVDSSSHRIYVTSENAVRAFEASGEPAEFTAGPGMGTDEIGGFGGLRGLAVDVNGDIYTSDGNIFLEGESISIFSPSGALITHAYINTEPAGNLAVDGDGNIYMLGGGGKVVKLEASSFPVTPESDWSLPKVFGPNPSLAVAVDPSSNDVYIAEAGGNPRIARYSQKGVLLSMFAGNGEPGEIEQSEGVGIDGDSARVFVSDFPSFGLSQVEIFQPVVSAPTIERTFAKDVTADSARLGVEINPNTRETELYFEYGLDDCAISDCTQVPLSGVTVGDGHNVVLVTQPISGLLAGTVYHYRVVAQNDLGAVESVDRTFRTQGSSFDISLSDSRVWEMVSPANKFGGILLNPPSGPMQAAADGNGLAYQSLGSIEAEAEGNRAIERSTVLAGRGEDGWHSRDLTPPHVKPTAPLTGSEFDVFNLDLSLAAVEPRDDNPLSPSASAKTPYLRINSEPPTYLPLVTSKEGAANVPPGTEFGGLNTEIKISGATPDLSYLVLRSEAPLASGAEPNALYGWHDGALQVTSALPAGEGGAVVAGLLGAGRGSTRNAISDDGSRVFWSQGMYDAAGVNTTALYMRNAQTEETVRLDVVQPGATGAGEARPAFQAASADGKVVYFTDTQQLTEDASPEGRDLYRCELVGPEPGQCELSNITAPRVEAGENAQVQGLVPAFSEDGTKAYFIAKGALTTQPNVFGGVPAAGEPNLYLWEKGEGVSYIATLSPEDRSDWGFKDNPVGYAFWLSSAGSPSGRYFAFMSELSLTGYDNRDSASGLPAQEVFLYDATTKKLECVSCNPSGSLPEGDEIHHEAGFTVVDPQSIIEDRLVAAALPEPRWSGELEYSFYTPRAVLDNGRVFFNAADSLVPADSNGTWDVYQYEPTGVGDCSGAYTNASITTTDSACVGLISSGTAEEESGFLDASVNGNDVFFLTPGRLSVLDKDTVNDVYDARVNGKAAELPPATECGGQDCRASAGPPVELALGSENFRGAGDRLQCPKAKRKVKRHGHVRCVPKKHKHKKHRKAGHTRRAVR